MEKPTRRQARENAFIQLFAASFGILPDTTEASVVEDEYPLDDYMKKILAECLGHLAEIDETIVPKLKSWTIDRLPRVSLQVLRMATAELLYGDEDMDSIVINEAVELAKKYGDEGDYQFVNGVLGSIAKDKAAQDARESRG